MTRKSEFTITAPEVALQETVWVLLGICGAGIRAFAEMLLDAGSQVMGSDSDTASLEALRVRSNHRFRILAWSEDLWSRVPHGARVVHSVAMSSSHAMLESAHRCGHRVQSLPQALGEFLHPTRQVCVAGTHGKTTTSGMIWWVLNRAGRSPAGFIGGEFCNGSPSGSFGAGRVSVIESCEYRQSFLHLQPQTAVLTGIESDHFDCFAKQSAADAAYERFVSQVLPNGRLIVNSASERAMRVSKTAACSVETFGTDERADWFAVPNPVSVASSQAVGISAFTRSMAQSLEIFFRGRKVSDLTIQVPGSHNVSNALAAFAALNAEGLDVKAISRHLGAFSGMRRRFEYRGHWNGVDWIDDFAHHPSAIATTLQTARSVFRGRRIIGVFEPHQVSRLENLFEEFIQALRGFDECLILPVLPAREAIGAIECHQMSGRLVQKVSEAGGRAFLVANLDQVPGRLDHAAKPGDVVITMGAGRTYQIHDENHRRLQRDSAA